MELDKIERLLERYFEGETTLSEEEKLRAYFSQGEVAQHLEQYAPFFSYFSTSKEEKFTKSIPLSQKNTKSNWSYKWLSVAAVTVLLLGVYFGKSYQDEKQLEKQRARYAYEETKKALDLLAQNFERGTEKVAYLNEFVEAKDKVYNKN
ncbi:hypothetical protein [Pareuzebyella sediminis]|uniref:hypothetical protein n=1 Tax=Pareuzebyella sediminis TaxID=2607998 RepID=UPI0011EF6FB5|nr:hypothetical protein [Pareuzebyella sediminis]